MDAIQSAAAALLNAVQAAAATGAEPALPRLPALLALVGQDVTLSFLGNGPGGLQLGLPSGQVITAQGALAYPEGTQLLVRILGGAPGTGDLRLQTLAAQTPAPAAILAPLLQSEAAALLNRLAQPEPGPALAPLAELHQLLQGDPPLPNRAQLQAALATLAPTDQAALRAALQAPPDQSSAAALETWLRETQASLPTDTRDLPQALVQRLLSALERFPDRAQIAKEPLGAWLKNLLTPFAEALERKLAAGLERPGKAPGSPAQQLQSLLSTRPDASPPAVPETWQAWIKHSVQVLADPAASPREAPFHAAQAKEGTAFYEVPLPWAPQAPLELWVESDRDPQGRSGQPETRTVLLGLKFTRLGETRLGLAKGPAGLQVRVWTEHPELLAAGRERLEQELNELSASVDLRILPLQPGPGGFVPSLKSLVLGPTLQALG